MIFLLVLGLLLLGSFAACYFSSKFWHWSHVLLTETVFLLSLAFLILVGEVFRIQDIYGKENQKNIATIERVEPVVQALKFGTDNSGVIATLEGMEVPVKMQEAKGEEEATRMMSVRDLDHELSMVTRTSGRLWRDVETTNLDADTLTVTLTIPVPSPHGIAKDAILYVFEQGETQPQGQRGPQYIGEFRVMSATDQQIQVQPASQFDQRSVDRLKNTTPPWILYENMPVDQHPDGLLEILAGKSNEELKRLLPPEVAAEYARHGSAAQPGDDQWHRIGYDDNGDLVLPDDWNAGTQFKFRRSLRDYNLIFQELSKRYTQMEADHQALAEDNKHLEKSLVSAKKNQAIREAEQAKLNTDVAGTDRDRKAITAHKSQVETQLSNARALLTDLIKQNGELAQQMGSSAP